MSSDLLHRLLDVTSLPPPDVDVPSPATTPQPPSTGDA